jgi:hypothetical protein
MSEFNAVTIEQQKSTANTAKSADLDKGESRWTTLGFELRGNAGRRRRERERRRGRARKQRQG